LSSQSNIKIALSVFHDRLSDGSNGPTMIVIPAGEFWMGSPENEAEREDNRHYQKPKLISIFIPFLPKKSVRKAMITPKIV
jgi:formylglycine-generating enzyme required for sulfatase activity